jgi:hypothetical protein
VQVARIDRTVLGFHVPLRQSVQPRSFVAVGISETNVPAGQFDHAVYRKEGG